MSNQISDQVFKQLPHDKTYCLHETDVLHFWKESNVYQQIIDDENDDTKEVFNFIDGPPFANGALHMGHLGVGSIKDAYQKHNHKLGKKCLNKLGYDTHGLPIESTVCKKLNLGNSAEIEKLGIGEFNKVCKETINSFANSWEPLYDIIGRWANFKNVYKTMDLEFMETVWWCFNQLWKKNLIYKGYNVMPFSYGCQTSLSNFEAGQNYKDITTRSIYVTFQLKNTNNRYLVIWTTTPWTLSSNLAICVNPELNYVLCIDDNNKEYIVGEVSVKNLQKEFTKIEPFGKGSDLVGLEYIPLYDNVISMKYHKVVSDKYVKDSDEVGTGLVHLAPAFGDDDCRICLYNKILTDKELDQVCSIDDEGKFTTGQYKGMLVFDSDKFVIKDLKSKNVVLREQHYEHKYPFCYRTDTPLIYRATDSIFIDVPQIKDDMLALNAQINWHPKAIGENRFANWIDTAKPWCVNRKRFFGTPIPIWISERGEMLCVGSIEELMMYSYIAIDTPTDLHPEFINKIILKSPITGDLMTRIPDVFDCWFESGVVPYGQIHYPFENKEIIDNNHSQYLCDFVVEGLDQTRGWFYTLLVMSTALSNKAPFKNVICSGLVLDKDGRKISKKYGNYIDPAELIQKYSADVLRMYLLGSPLVRAEPLKFAESDVTKLKQRIIPLINGVKFFLEHFMNFTNKGFTLNKINSAHIMDIWILDKVHKLRHSIVLYIDNYQIDKAIMLAIEFIEDITNWYIKFNRDRLKGLCDHDEWNLSLLTLYTVFMEYINCCSPFMPFLSEHLYQHLKMIIPNKFTKSSIHQMLYNNVVDCIDSKVSQSFSGLQTLVKMIRLVRDNNSKTHPSIKIPILSCTIYHNNQQYLNELKSIIDIIQDEVNCLEFYFELSSENITELKIKPNNRTLGMKFRNDMPKIKQMLAELDQNFLSEHTNFDTLTVGDFVLDKNDFEIVKVNKNNEQDHNLCSYELDGIKITANMKYDNVTHELYQIRKFVINIQNIRKELGLRPWNDIMLIGQKTCQLIGIFDKYNSYVQSRLKTSIAFTSIDVLKYTFVWENFDGSKHDVFFDVLVKN